MLPQDTGIVDEAKPEGPVKGLAEGELMSRKLQCHQCKYGDGAKTQQQASDGLYFPATVWAKHKLSSDM
jgi:hypothetical protein